jgi:formylglycine-generating enzyme required for sulfatase activity
MSFLPLLKRAWPAFVLALAATLALAGESTNRLGITMVDIPAGSFVMGSCLQDKKSAFLGESSCANPDPEASGDETPQHRVSVRTFKLGKTEVTLGQFKAFIKATGNSQLVDDDFIKYNAYGDSAPVVRVSWEDAQAFISWLNQIDGGGWRLPSEAEWEYVARSVPGGRSWGDFAWYDANSGGHQHPVATKQANNMGVYDMSGNVWEWVEDCWHDSYRGAPSDGSAWTSACKGDGRAQRGGSWNFLARDLRAAIRDIGSPGNRNYRVGFRLARTR